MIFKGSAVTRTHLLSHDYRVRTSQSTNLPLGLASARIFLPDGHDTAVGSVPPPELNSSGVTPGSLDLPRFHLQKAKESSPAAQTEKADQRCPQSKVLTSG